MGDLASKSDNSTSSSVENRQVALNDGGVGISSSSLANVSIEYGDKEVAKNALDISKAIANSAYETIYYVLDANSRFQDRALNSVDASVAAAQNIAERAAPVSPGSYAEATAGQNTRMIITVAIVIGAAVVLTTLISKK